MKTKASDAAERELNTAINEDAVPTEPAVAAEPEVLDAVPTDQNRNSGWRIAIHHDVTIAKKCGPGARGKFNPPLHGCPACAGGGVLVCNIFGPGGETADPFTAGCPCREWKRRGNPNFRENLRRFAEIMGA